jgi:predicted esterase
VKNTNRRITLAICALAATSCSDSLLPSLRGAGGADPPPPSSPAETSAGPPTCSPSDGARLGTEAPCGADASGRSALHAALAREAASAASSGGGGGSSGGESSSGSGSSSGESSSGSGSSSGESSSSGSGSSSGESSSGSGSSSGESSSSGGGSSSGGASSSSGSSGSGGDEPGPPPTASCNIAKGKYVTRTSGGAKYVVYVPKSYDGSPARLLIGLHGCGDTALNYADWGLAPYETRATQTHIGLSLDGASGNSSCWNVGNDKAKVLAALDDISRCLYIHQKKIVVSGFSSGGILAYTVGLENAARFAGILILNSGLYATGKADALLANASRKLPIAHRAHKSDTVFPLSKLQPDWVKIRAAGFALDTASVAGDHDGTSGDWAFGLIPKMADWRAP